MKLQGGGEGGEGKQALTWVVNIDINFTQVPLPSRPPEMSRSASGLTPNSPERGCLVWFLT